MYQYPNSNIIQSSEPSSANIRGDGRPPDVNAPRPPPSGPRYR